MSISLSHSITRQFNSVSECLQRLTAGTTVRLWFDCVHVSTMTARRLDGRSQIKVHTDERTEVHSAQSADGQCMAAIWPTAMHDKRQLSTR